MIALEITCVVDTGMPKCEAPRMMVAAVVSAAKPCTGSSLTTRWPIVRMIRQPPAAVPNEIAEAATRITSVGISNFGMTPAENRARAMTPIVFWASFEPWLNAMNAAETTWSRRKRSLIRAGWARRKRFSRTTMKPNPITTPSTGDVTRGKSTLPTMPSTLSTPVPAATIDAPIRPPISEWLLELGIPSRHVSRFHTMAPMIAAAT